MNFPEKVPYLSIICSVSVSSISPVSESTTLSSNSWAISQRAFEGVSIPTGCSLLKKSLVSLYGASPSWVLIWTFIPGIFIIGPVKYDIYSSTLLAYPEGLERALFTSSIISFGSFISLFFGSSMVLLIIINLNKYFYFLIEEL